MEHVHHLQTTNQHPLTVASAPGSRVSLPVPSLASGFSFQDMGQDYEFFMPGLITAVGGFDRDVVSEFVRYHPASVPDGDPFVLDYAAVPFFTGIGRRPHPNPSEPLVDWDCRIYAIARERWVLCRDFILGIAFHNPADRSYTRLAFYELTLIDPIAIQRATVVATVPRFPVSVFAVSSNKRFSYLNPDGAGPPRLTHTAPQGETVQEAARAGTREPDPHSLHTYKKRRHSREDRS